MLETITQYDVQIEVGYLTATVVGETDVVFGLIQDMYQAKALENERFRFHVELLSPEKNSRAKQA